MADIIHFPKDEAVAAEAHVEATEDSFLIDEGLDLLAAFRAIEDQAVRATIMTLVKTLATSDRRATGGH